MPLERINRNEITVIKKIRKQTNECLNFVQGMLE